MKITSHLKHDHVATDSDQTKFKVAEGRSKVAVRCDRGITFWNISVQNSQDSQNSRWM